MNIKKDGFSGFLNGYKAQNLENVMSSADIQIKQIQKTAGNLSKKLPDDKISSSLLKEISMSNFSSQSLIKLGMKIKELLIFDKANAAGLQKDNEFKMLVLNYLDIAQNYADNKVIDIALELGELLDT